MNLSFTQQALNRCLSQVFHVLVPTVKASARTQQALRNPNLAVQLLAAASADDRLNPASLNLCGRFYLQHYSQISGKQAVMLMQAAEYFSAATQLDKADFKNYEKLMRVYQLLAMFSTFDHRGDWLQKAYDSGIEAARRYPGKGMLQFELGKIAERLSNKKTALSHYEEAVEIEDSYRAQFRIMYPGREMFSRLGQSRYEAAKKRIAWLED